MQYQMASDINVQQIMNHVIYLYHEFAETSDECNFKQNDVLGEKCTLQLDIHSTALLNANLRLLRDLARLLII